WLVIKAGNLQYMSAGSGIRHSEFNPSKSNRVHFLQVWLMPSDPGGEPRYAGIELAKAAKNNALTLLLAGHPRGEAIEIRQDAEVYFGRLDKGHSVAIDLGTERFAWVHIIEGQLQLLNDVLRKGDGAGVSKAQRLDLSARQTAQFLFFNLA
ncbi:MAG: pirin family protein, partial [Candidatus Omnitrophica bacterium]|nr:pirin family protein [Candidatus Omnitrophota bacterium]